MKWFFQRLSSAAAPDDALFWGLIGFLTILALASFIFMFWLTGLRIFHGGQDMYWPGLIVSITWVVVGGAAFALAGWLFWQFGKVLQRIARGFSDSE